ncbi:two-component regulator propeller domain-containing protein [Geothrix sp. PMB-07]|uniref:two-component regulator propeller domain-containing protein n=1 Tax=Geothrix sp. PMB-07 TaxID=3068640 RepID=UPI00274087BA|nr:two-component regulator propeller domain-containing protein [Geothrix sp. PMB-07]WLT33460.1 two-component regulator propeller domain-containing protein [Geothrix sp. PMB-07]
MKALRILLVVMAAWVAWAGEGWRRPFALYGPDQGLPSGGIMCIAQDADGFIWLGTEHGLLRYEGGRCSRWTRDQGLPSDHVEHLFALKDGGLWVSTAQGLVRFRNGQVEPTRFAGEEGFPGLRAMAEDPFGRLWVATRKGLFLQSQGLDFVRHPRAPAGEALALANGRAGTMLVGTDLGLTSFTPYGIGETWTEAQGLPKGGAALVGEDGTGRLWVCSGRTLVVKEAGAARFSDQSRLMKAAATPFGAFFKDRDGALWLSTLKGALRLNGTEASLLDESAGLPMRWVGEVFRDREDGLWILGTTIARLQGEDRVWNHPLSTGSSGELVWSILRHPQGDLLVGTDDGVIRMMASGNRRIPGTEGCRINGMTVDRSGVLWMVGATGPALWLRPDEGRARVAPLGALGTGLNSVMTDASGQVWAGHVRQGILRWNPGEKRLIQVVGPDGKRAKTLCAFQIREDASGRLWVASTLGLHLREKGGGWRLFTEQDGLLPFGLHGLAFLPDGSAWIHPIEPQGIMRIRIDRDKVTVLDRRHAGQGLSSDLVYAVGVDPLGRTWVTTDQGFDCLDTQVHVGRRQGIISEDCNLLALLPERDRIWVGTSAGLVRYEAHVDEPKLVGPVPHILQVTLGDRLIEGPATSLGSIQPEQATLGFRVAVPTYQHEGQLKLQVRMVGLQESWRDLEAPVTRYSHLPGASYRFEARAAQPNGSFGPPVSLSFKVLPAWWGTWWARSLWGLAGLGFILLIVRLRVAKLARRKAELEIQVEERTWELQNRNQELTDALGKVKQLSGLLPICASCKKIRDDRGYWNQLEHYFSEHTEVGFSHGICPECADTLYPGARSRRARQSSEPER